MNTEASFQPERNCDSIRHADRFSLLIDGSDYFRELREAITRALRTVFILGRDIGSLIKLTAEGADAGSARCANGRALTSLRGISSQCLMHSSARAAGPQDGMAYASAGRIPDGRQAFHGPLASSEDDRD